MKKTLLLLLTALALLCGCTAGPVIPTVSETALPTIYEPPVTESSEAPTESVPVYDQTPEASQTAVTIDGETLIQTYQCNDDVLLCATDLAALLDAPLTQEAATDGTFSGELQLANGTARFDNAGTTLIYRGERIALACRCLFDGTHWYLHATGLLQKLGYTLYNDSAQNHLYFTRFPDVSQIPKGYDIPVLMYHAVSDNIWSSIAELFVSPSSLEQQLQYLQDNGYTAIFFEDLPQLADFEKPVLLTFDDGYRDNYEELFPLLQKYNTKATIFCTGDGLGKEHTLDPEQIKEMSDSGLVSIQSHTMTHRFLSTLDEEQTEYELKQSQLVLLRITGKQPFVLCYPTGYYSKLTLRIAEKYYNFGVLMSGGHYSSDGDSFLIGRRYIARSTTLSQFAAMLG